MSAGSYTCRKSEVPLLGMTIGEMINAIAAKYPDNDTIVSVPQNIRWPGQALTEDEVREFCKGKIAHYKIPR